MSDDQPLSGDDLWLFDSSVSRADWESMHQWDAADWRPLERFTAASRGRLDVTAFMWMGSTDLDDGSTLQLYKHIDTRRYVNLDDAGYAWRHESPEGYVMVASPDIAINHVLDIVAAPQPETDPEVGLDL